MMERYPFTNIQRIQMWVEKKQPGDLFTSRDIAKELDLTSVGVGLALKWQDNVRMHHRSSVASLWERI